MIYKILRLLRQSESEELVELQSARQSFLPSSPFSTLCGHFENVMQL